jgi:hypothetical protein
VNLNKATKFDRVQIGIAWLDLKNLKDYNIYPKKIKECIDVKGNIISPLYMGEVN